MSFLTLLVVLLIGAACATPVGVMRSEPKLVYRSLSQSVLSSDEPSAFTQQLLRQQGLDQRFAKDPQAVLQEMHRAGPAHDPDQLFALSELSFFHGRESGRREYYLAAAVYAYAFLVSGERRAGPSPAGDPRVRWAADLYNVGLTLGLTAAPSPVEGAEAPPDEVLLTDRTLELPFGQLELRGHQEQFLWGGYRLTRFIPLVEYRVRGLRNRYRQAGLGVPLAAEVTPVASDQVDAARKRIPPRIKVPVTAFVKFEDVLQGLANGRIRGGIELYSADETTTVKAEGFTLPLELDRTAALALMLEGAPVWDSELAGFLRGSEPILGDGLLMLHPYRPGRVPVILVHGTASSPARWADIVNEIQNDPALRNRVQVWLFMYNTSNPVLLSAAGLRTALQNIISELDAPGRDAALRRMVVMGHSQGGLLTRLMVTDSGDRFWANVSSRPLSELKMTPETRALLQGGLFFEPVPTVTRVVFMATPHQGSFRVSTFVLGLVRRLVTLPLRLVKDFGDLVARNPELAAHAGRGLPTAVDNMRPGHPFVKTLSASPLAPGVTAHSIVAVQGTGDVLALNDGVVAYRSAHLAGVASEKIVHSSHSMQSNPMTILEVRRILREHLKSQ